MNATASYFVRGIVAALSLSTSAQAAQANPVEGSYITTRDGVQLYYKAWGPKNGPVVTFSHGWPLNSDSWESQMKFLAEHGYRVVAHDRRGHGRSSQPWDGNDMDHYADDLAAVINSLDLKNATLVGVSTGGGEVARYIGRHGTARVKKAVLVSAVTPLMLRTTDNPGGLPIEVFDGLRKAHDANRAQRSRLGPVLRLQPARCNPLAGIDPDVLRAGHAGWRQEHVRFHCRVLGHGLTPGPEEVQRTDARDSRRR